MAAAVAASAPPDFDALIQIPPFDARLALAKACLELNQNEVAAGLLERLLAEDESAMEVWYLAGEAYYYAGDAESAADRLRTADDMLTAAIDRVAAIAHRTARARRGVRTVTDTAAYEADGLMRFSLPELKSQRAMMRKLLAVVTGDAPPLVAAAAAAGGGSGSGGGGGVVPADRGAGASS